MREEDCACAKDYSGANCTSQQAVGGCVTPRDEQLPAWRGGVARAAEAAAGPGRGAALGPLSATRNGGRAPDAHDLAGPEGGR